jgi:hypothetical protein
MWQWSIFSELTGEQATVVASRVAQYEDSILF